MMLPIYSKRLFWQRVKRRRSLRFTPSRYEELLGRDFLFALRCLGDNIPVWPTNLKKLVKRLADKLLYQKGSAIYSRYRQALYERLKYLTESEGAIALYPYIIAAIYDADAYVRSNAV